MSWEVIPFPEQGNSPKKWGEILQNAEEQIVSEQVIERFEVERVMMLGKVFPFLLKWEDFSKMVIENAYDRDPELFQNHEDEPLIERVENTVTANDNMSSIAKAA
jgi:hypothetical protein